MIEKLEQIHYDQFKNEQQKIKSISIGNINEICIESEKSI